MKFFQSGTRSTLTGLTLPPRINRRLASPDADTMSYCEPPPWRISVTISSDEPPYLVDTWQPVCCSKGLTHCGCVYPSQAIRVSLPSPLPIVCGRFDADELELSSELPQAAT